jgi:hypothetical protein
MNDSKKEDVIKIYLLFVAHIKLWVVFFVFTFTKQNNNKKKMKSITFYLKEKKINLFLLRKFDILL